jgi:hypothetical protein
MIRPVAKIKTLFFDRARVGKAVDAATIKGLRQFGALTRTIARRSMKKRNKPSEPGTPPSVRKGTLKKLLFFVLDRKNKNVIVGPTPFKGPIGVVPPILEYGGKVDGGRKNPRRTVRVVGKPGEVRIGGKKSVATKRVRDKSGDIVAVTYAKLTTPDQVRRANQLNAELYGGQKLPSYEVEQRPFMAPAFEQAKEKLPDVWAGAIK